MGIAFVYEAQKNQNFIFVFVLFSRNQKKDLIFLEKACMLCTD